MSKVVHKRFSYAALSTPHSFGIQQKKPRSVDGVVHLPRRVNTHTPV